MVKNMRACRILICTIAVLLSFGILMAAQHPVYADAETSITADGSEITGFDTAISEIRRGSVYLELTGEEFLAAGYAAGDLVSVKIGEMEQITMPFIEGFTGIGFRKVVLQTSPMDGRLTLRMSDGNFAETYGITDEQVGLPVTIKMEAREGFLKEYQAWDIKRLSSERSDFPDLTDEEFANFRMVSTTGMKEGVLYRTSSPINPMIKRNKIADEANRAAGVTTIINLSETPESAAAREGYDQTYYITVNHIEVDMKTDFGSDDFNERLVRGYRFMIEHPGVFEVNCIFGKDRTGFVIAVLEALAGASYDELVADYAVTFPHYYPAYNSYTPIAERDQIIAEGNLIAQMEYAYGVDDLKNADLRMVTEAYLQKCGMTSEEIEQLKNCICAKEISPKVTLSKRSYTYNGKARKPSVKVMDGKTVLDRSQYTVTYASGRKDVGKYKVTVKMKGDYIGTKNVSFKIVPKGTKISTLKGSAGTVKVRWRKQGAKMSGSRISGYQIQIASNKNFTKNKKTVTVKGYRHTSKVVTGLKSSKDHFARIRTYKKIGGEKLYSPWSAIKKAE